MSRSHPVQSVRPRPLRHAGLHRLLRRQVDEIRSTTSRAGDGAGRAACDVPGVRSATPVPLPSGQSRVERSSYVMVLVRRRGQRVEPRGAARPLRSVGGRVARGAHAGPPQYLPDRRGHRCLRDEIHVQLLAADHRHPRRRHRRQPGDHGRPGLGAAVRDPAFSRTGSTHAATGAAAASTLARALGDRHTFTITNPSGAEPKPTIGSAPPPSKRASPALTAASTSAAP